MFPEVCLPQFKRKTPCQVYVARRACGLGWCSGSGRLDIVRGKSQRHPGVTASYSSNQLLRSFLADTEKTYSGLTDGCAAAGRAGCKLIEITGDNASGDDVKALINNAHDVINFLSKPEDQTDSVLTPGGSPALSRWGTTPHCPWPPEGYGFRHSPPGAQLLTSNSLHFRSPILPGNVERTCER